MNTLARRLFFTDKATIKDAYGNVFEIEGVYFNWLGRNVPEVVTACLVAISLVAVCFK